MSVKGKQNLVSLNANEDLSALRNTFVKIDTADTNGVKSATSGVTVGILQNAPQKDEVAIVATAGSWSYLSASAAITAGAAIKATTGGQGVTSLSDKDYYGARAVTSVTQTNSLVEVIVTDAYLAC